MLLLLAIVAGAKALQILQLADFHLDVDYSISGDNQKMCHGTGSSGSKLGIYGDYMCDAPTKLVEYTLEEAKRIIPNPDLILWTGDNVPHIDDYDWNCESLRLICKPLDTQSICTCENSRN
ncbi:hypothetical protein OESDEN_04543 [Oesophagostomum dentatum]|uniref:Uncharacterized protein n=1 Tax=Oesophagostomum dentatum TaxID=61180 RepID=A0A0B1TJB5_OESDE|nr:hypothetical protein OESDEN_04543 [Oesophagostomum dentatum]